MSSICRSRLNAASAVFVILALATGIKPAVAQPACVPAPAGLVSWWRGEHDAYDAMGVNNGPKSSDYWAVSCLPGKVGFAFHFDNQDGPVDVTDSASLRLTNALTIEAWIYPSNVAGTRTIVGKFDVPSGSPGTNSGYFFGLTNGLLWLAVSPNGSVSSSVRLISAQRVPTNQWSHVAGTYDGAALRIYFNGTEVAQTNYSRGIFPSRLPLGIGGVEDWTSSSYFGWLWAGLLDEVALYNRALSESELLAIYNADAGGKCLQAPVVLGQPQSQAVSVGEDVAFRVSVSGTRRLRCYWFFNGRSFTTTVEPVLVLEKVLASQAGSYSVLVSNTMGSALSSNATLAVVPPAPGCAAVPPGVLAWWSLDNTPAEITGSTNQLLNVDYGPGKSLQAARIEFGGSTGGTLPYHPYVRSPWLNFSADADFSIEAWVKHLPLFAPSSRATILAKHLVLRNRGLGAGYSLFLEEGRLGCALIAVAGGRTNSVTFISNEPDLRDGMFHHVALTLVRRVADGGRLYVDGQPVLTFDPTSCRGDLSNSGPLYLGGLSPYDSFPFADWSYLPPFSGRIDEPTIYSRALSAAEVLAICQAGAAGKCKTAPLISAQPVDQAVLAGTTAAFSAAAQGTPYLKYQWRRDGVNIAGATNSSLVLTNVQASQAGLYSVRVTNFFGAVLSSNAALTLNSAPVAACTNVVVTAGADCLAPAVVNNGSFDPDGDPIACEQSPPGPYPVGLHQVALRATDSHGAMSQCSAWVLVVDQTPPVIVCANVAATNAHDQWTSRVSYSPAATDNCTGIGPVRCNPPSGTAFGLGAHTVTCTVSDAAGNSNQCAFHVTVWPGNTAPVPVIEVSPLALFPGYTNLIVIAPDSRHTGVKFDGSGSYDVDDTNFFFGWYEGTNCFGTNVVATRQLAVGSHDIILTLNDTFPLGSSSGSVTVEVITPAQAVGIILELLEKSDLSPKRQHVLRVHLAAAVKAFETGRAPLASLQLLIFQHQVRAQVTPVKLALAEELLKAADTILDALAHKHDCSDD